MRKLSTLTRRAIAIVGIAAGVASIAAASQIYALYGGLSKDARQDSVRLNESTVARQAKPDAASKSAGKYTRAIQPVLGGALEASALYGAAPMFAVGSDFKQAANGTTYPPAGNLDWINSIIQESNSRYYEGMSVPQRVVLDSLPGGTVHTLKLSHQASKGGTHHAYDYFTSWEQARLAPLVLSNQNLLGHLVDQFNGPSFGPGAEAVATALVTGSFYDADAPDTMTPSGGPGTLIPGDSQTVDQSIDDYELAFGNRTVRVYAPGIVSASMTFDGYTQNGGDYEANYTLTWTTSGNTTEALIRYAGHLAAGRDNLGVGYGPGHGSGDINGGPYHQHLGRADGESLGNQDNQIKGSGVFAPPDCTITQTAGSLTCPGTLLTFCAPNATGMTYAWTITETNNTAGASIVGPTNGQCVNVTTAHCGSFEVNVLVTDANGVPGFCHKTVVVGNTTAPEIHCPGDLNLDCTSNVDAAIQAWLASAYANDDCPVQVTNNYTGVTGGCGRTGTALVTWTATDSCGNTSTCSATVTVTDTTPPTFDNCPSDITVQCESDVPAPPTVTATDNCGTVVIGQMVVFEQRPDPCTHIITRVWPATDQCGNVAQCTQVVTVHDTTPPELSGQGAEQTINCPDVPQFTPPTATDHCDPNPQVIEVSDVTTPGNCPGVYDRTKTWKAKDSCNNESATVSQTIHVVDVTAPVIGQPGANGTINCPDVPQFTPPTATDTCDANPTIVEVSDVTTPGNCPGVYDRTKTWKARDCSGNESTTVSQTIHVVDVTAPVIGQPGPGQTINCPDIPQFTPPTATDTCDANPQIIEVSDQTNPGNCPGVYTRTKTWKARDCSGNESTTVSQTITVVDVTAPVIGQPGANGTINCPDVPQFTPPTATDTCDANPQIIEVGDVTTPSDCPGVYSRTKSWIARDCSGNQSGPVSQTINVVDVTAPVIGQPGANGTINCPDVPQFTPPTATDTCDAHPQVIEVSDITTPGNCPGVYDRTKTWKARDCSGNESTTVSQTIHVVDVTAPVIGQPGAEGTINCPDIPQFTPPTATDTCDANPQIIEVSDVTTPSDCPGVYSRTKSWKARDCSGNESNTVSQTIHVVDVTSPVIGQPGANVTIECPSAPEFTPPTATDTCDANPRIVEVSDQTTPGNCPGTYSRTKTWKAVDCSGNESTTVSQTITVEDHTAPVIGQPGANNTIECPATPEFTPPTATDTCDAHPSIVEVSDVTTPGECPNLFTRTKTWKAVDCSGNESTTVSQTITVQDTTMPVFELQHSCPTEPIVIQLQQSAPCETVVPRPDIRAADACDQDVEITFTRSDGRGIDEPFPGGQVTTVTVTASDGCNEISCQYTVEVKCRTTSELSGKKYYDLNMNGAFDEGEPTIDGFRITCDYTDPDTNLPVHLETTTAAGGAYTFSVPLNVNVTICEVMPTGNWIQTAPASTCYTFQATDPVYTGLDFGNVCFTPGFGGHTLGFWSNKNGLIVLTGHDPEWRNEMNALRLRNKNGQDFDVNVNNPVTAAHKQFASWLLDANATNMAYMLSAQLAATKLSSLYNGLPSGAVPILPASMRSCIESFAAAHNLPAGPYSVQQLMDMANIALTDDGQTPDGDQPNRGWQTCLKDACDGLNNNRWNFLNLDPCIPQYGPQLRERQ